MNSEDLQIVVAASHDDARLVSRRLVATLSDVAPSVATRDQVVFTTTQLCVPVIWI